MPTVKNYNLVESSYNFYHISGFRRYLVHDIFSYTSIMTLVFTKFDELY